MVAQMIERVGDVLVVAEEQAFGDLDGDVAGGKVDHLEQVEPIQPVEAHLELARRSVDADMHDIAIDGPPDLLGEVGPLPGDGGGALEHPVADRQDEAGFLGQGDEFRGRDRSLVGMVPTQERLGIDDIAGGEVDDRLVMHVELAVLQGAPQIEYELMARRRRPLHFGGEPVETGSAGTLGGIHRLIGVLHQGFGAVAIVGEAGQADAGRDLGGRRAYDEGYVEAFDQILGHALGLPALPDVGQDHGEFVAAQAGYRVGIAHRLDHALAGLNQQGVADIVAELVVDLLEAVEIHQHHRHLGAVAARQLDGALQPVAQQAPVGQLGQGVVIELLEDDVLGGVAMFQQRVDVGDQARQFAVPHGKGDPAVALGADGLQLAGNTQQGLDDPARDHQDEDRRRDDQRRGGDRRIDDGIVPRQPGQRLMVHLDQDGADRFGRVEGRGNFTRHLLVAFRSAFLGFGIQHRAGAVADLGGADEVAAQEAGDRVLRDAFIVGIDAYRSRFFDGVEHIVDLLLGAVGRHFVRDVIGDEE